MLGLCQMHTCREGGSKVPPRQKPAEVDLDTRRQGLGGGFRGLCGCASLKQHPTKLRPAGVFLGTVSCAPLPMCGKRFVCQSAHVGQNQTTRGLQVLVHVSIYWTRVHVGHISLTHSHEPTPEPKRAKEGPAFPGADGGAEAGGFEPNASLEAALRPRTTSKTDTPSYK